MPKNLPLQHLLPLLVLLVVACAATLVNGQTSSGFQFSCPGDEDLLYVGCRFIDEELLNSVKQGQSDELSLVTQNVDRMSSVCSSGCRLQMEECIPMSPAYGLAVRYCGCRSALSTDCDASLSIALPVFMNPQFSVSNYYLGLDAGVPVTEELNEARSEVCGSSCRTPLETSEQCSYTPLRDAINAMCCGPISQQCTDLYTNIVDLSDPTADPERFPEVATLLAAVDTTKTLTERRFALQESEGINTVSDLFLAPIQELCAELDTTPTELSTTISSCKSECSGLAKPEVEEEATSLAALCSAFFGDGSPCIREAIEACMPSFSAARLLSIEEGVVAAGRTISDPDGSRRRLLLDYEGAEQTLFQTPTARMLDLIGEATESSNPDEWSDDDLQVLHTSLCSAECGAQIECPALGESSALPISSLFGELKTLRSGSFCVTPTPTPTTTPPPPPTPSSPVTLPPPPVTTAPPVPSTTPSGTVQYFLSTAELVLSLDQDGLTEEQRQALISNLDEAAGEDGTVTLHGIRASEGQLTAHVSVYFKANDAGAGQQLTSALEDTLNGGDVFSSVLSFSSVANFKAETGTTFTELEQRLEALSAQYSSTQPPPPAASTPAPGSTERQYRVVQIEVDLPMDGSGDFTDALEAQMVSELAALQGVNPENVHILNVADGNVVKLAVVVIDEGGAGQDGNYQNLLTSMASASNFFSREFGEVTTRILGTDTSDSLAAANQSVATLKEDSAGEDSAADQVSSSLSLLLAALLGMLLL